MKSWWFDPFWKLTEPWKLRVWRAGDEFWRRTLAVQLPMVGQLVIADPRAGLTDEEYDWLYERRQQSGVARREMALYDENF